MGSNTKIEFAEHSWNPWYGCSRVSEGCDNCYAERWAKRAPFIENFFGGPKLSKRGIRFPRSKHHKPGDFVFVCSLSDFFHRAVRSKWRADALQVMADRPELIFLLLTKRIEIAEDEIVLIKEHIPDLWPKLEKNRNVWLGVTAENQRRADERIPILLEMKWPGRKFASVEPMIGGVDLGMWLGDPTGIACCSGEPEYCQGCKMEVALDKLRRVTDDGMCMYYEKLDWVIAGGESGKNARPIHPDAVRHLRDQCAATNTVFTFKQWGKWAPVDVWDDEEYFGGIVCKDPSGGTVAVTGFGRYDEREDQWWLPVGKDKSGKTLDGQTHLGRPEPEVKA